MRERPGFFCPSKGAVCYFYGTYIVTVRSNNSAQFRGVLLQGRFVADDTSSAGTFDVGASLSPFLRRSDCSPTEVRTNCNYIGLDPCRNRGGFLTVDTHSDNHTVSVIMHFIRMCEV